MALSHGVRLGGEEREIAAVFIDMTDFTPLAQAAAPAELVRLLNRFFRVVIEVVEAEHGMVNKFEGDAALCVFGAPVSRENPTVDALRAARALAELAKQRPGRVLASDAALDRAPSHESEGWHMTEAATLRGRSVPTGLGQPTPRAG